jgi:hypothetical protein
MQVCVPLLGLVVGGHMGMCECGHTLACSHAAVGQHHYAALSSDVMVYEHVDFGTKNCVGAL